MNWINQHVIDAVVNGVGTGAGGRRRLRLRQHRPDASSTVPSTAPGAVAEGTGEALQPVQSGKVSQYGALLFGAAAVGALILVIVV